MRTDSIASVSRTLVLRAFIAFTLFAVAGIASAQPQSGEASKTDTTLYRVGGDVQAPRPIATPLPTAPERPDKQKKVVVSFVVMPDGSVRDVKLLKRYKADFDTAAVDAVAKWRFEPARKDGKAVAVRLETEVKFSPVAFSTSP